MKKELETEIRAWFDCVAKGHYSMCENVTIGDIEVRYAFYHSFGDHRLAGGISVEHYNRAKAEIEGIRNSVGPRVEDGALESRRAVSKLFADADKEQDYPNEYYVALERARKALRAWKAGYPIAAKYEQEENARQVAEEKARREEQYQASFVARGLD